MDSWTDVRDSWIARAQERSFRKAVQTVQPSTALRDPESHVENLTQAARNVDPEVLRYPTEDLYEHYVTLLALSPFEWDDAKFLRERSVAEGVFAIALAEALEAVRVARRAGNEHRARQASSAMFARGARRRGGAR